jgi:hypothetical protein
MTDTDLTEAKQAIEQWTIERQHFRVPVNITYVTDEGLHSLIRALDVMSLELDDDERALRAKLRHEAAWRSIRSDILEGDGND